MADMSIGGGMPMSTNRTKWPVKGGAVGLQPGWFSGHANALMYINLGDGTVPDNYSLPMQTVFGIVGPQNTLYNGSICIPQVPLPVNYTAVVGANATIQIIETAQHGAALYNVRFSPFASIWHTLRMLILSPNSAWTSHLPSQKMFPKSLLITAQTHQISHSNTSTTPT